MGFGLRWTNSLKKSRKRLKNEISKYTKFYKSQFNAYFMPRTKILPVYPEYPDTYWSYKDTMKLMGRKALMFPTGLPTVLAMLPRDKFDIMQIVDMNTATLRDADLKAADFVFTSSMVVQQNSLRQVIDRAHSFNKKVVAGGPHPTIYSDEVPADSIVAGEAELTFPRFVEDLLSGRELKKIYTPEECLDHRIKVSREGRPLLTQTPIPRWDLLDFKDYYSAAVQYTRGCPNICEFCNIAALNGREPRTKEPEQMIRELDSLYGLGWRGQVFIVDDNVIGNLGSVRKLLPRLIDWQKRKGYPFTFYTQAGMNLASPSNKDILEGMVEAGTDMVFLGIESPNAASLAETNKHQNKGDLVEQVRRIQKAGLQVTAGFVLGFDSDPPTIFDDMYDFIQKTGIVTPMPGLLTAAKGTRLYNRLQSEGRLRGEHTGNNTHDLNMNFVPRMDEKTLIDGYVHLLERLFAPENYYARCRIAKDHIGPNRTGHSVDLRALVGTAKLLYHKVLEGEWEFFRYLGDTIINSPKNIPQAIADGIRLHHHKRITGEIVKARGFQTQIERTYQQLEHKLDEMKGGVSAKLEEARMNAEQTLNEAKERYHSLSNSVQAKVKPYLNKLEERIRDTFK